LWCILVLRNITMVLYFGLNLQGRFYMLIKKNPEQRGKKSFAIQYAEGKVHESAYENFLRILAEDFTKKEVNTIEESNRFC